MNEKLIEKKLRESVRKKGGLALKFVSPAFTGVPDRIILMPAGKIKFVETKSTGVKVTPRQKYVHDELQELGFEVWVIDDNIKLQNFLNAL